MKDTIKFYGVLKSLIRAPFLINKIDKQNCLLIMLQLALTLAKYFTYINS